MQRKRRVRKSGSNSTFSILRKELREGNLQALLGGSQYLVSSNAEPDTLLSSFIYNPSPDDQSARAQPHSSVETCSVKEISKEDIPERYEHLVLLIKLFVEALSFFILSFHYLFSFLFLFFPVSVQGISKAIWKNEV